jgi:ectoine hydroxylase-related dioxygenase (phytanoyl-CoA dioxygenase family)
MIDGVANFAVDGFAVVPDVVSAAQCDTVAAHPVLAASDAPGTRSLLLMPWCAALVQAIRNNKVVRSLLPENPVAVQCTYFEKSASQNWLVAVHQDLSIPVRERIDAAACSAWSEKEGVLFVQPPATVLENIVAVRLHLGDSTLSNGPLRVVPGSHRRGRLTSPQARAARDESGEIPCPVPKGGTLIMRPLLLHASSKAQVGAPRRVLHFVFGTPALPLGLNWHTAV